MSEVAALETEVKEYKLQLETVLSGIQTDPDNAELQSLKSELEEVISLTETAIAELKPASAPTPPAPQSQPVKEKWSRENHPAYQAGYRKPAVEEDEARPLPTPAPAASFQVNDTVLAKWVGGDHSFYPARITSITGSSSNPVYIVTFKSYNETATLAAKDIRPISNNDSKKRKADGISGNSTPQSFATPPPPPPQSDSLSGGIISAAANINPALATQARQEPSKVSDGPPRAAKAPRKVKANKELEAGKNKWQDFTAKGKMGKGGKKDSMFRTPDGVHGRVGFTGSGQTMRKDPTRSRHIYQKDDNDGY